MAGLPDAPGRSSFARKSFSISGFMRSILSIFLRARAAAEPRDFGTPCGKLFVERFRYLCHVER
jgi:hypothetical protein